MPSFPQGNIVYQQPWLGTGDGWASQNDTNMFGNYAACFDDFTLLTTTSITNAAWVGGYFNPSLPAPISAWDVNFLSDNGGLPGSIIATTHIFGNGNETFLGIFPDKNGDQNPMYSYFVDISFQAIAGTKYWFSVVPSVGFPPEWVWSFGSGNDGTAYQNFFGTLSQITPDLNFALYGAGGGTAPPSPGSYFKLQKLVVSVKQDNIPVRGRNK